MEKLFNLGRKIIPRWLFKFGQPFWHFFLALTGNILYRFPGKKLICIGVTGTNGKSTTVELVNSVLKETGAKTGMLSTIAIEIAGERKDNTSNRTTLGRWQTPKLLRQMVKAGCKYVVIEVASEGIIQFRTWGIPFDVAVFTNLSPEHLNTHKTMTNYRNAKGKLFANLATSTKKKKVAGARTAINKISVVNADDREAPYFSAFPADIHFSFGLKKGNVRALALKTNNNLAFEIQNGKKVLPIKSALLGTYNAYNILAAYCVGSGLGLDDTHIKKGIEAVKLIPGRMEEVKSNRNFRVFVDYAMTPDSYKMLFKETKKLAKGKLITVFGAAGGKDTAKRPKIGAVAAQKTDWIILTDDEPYNEAPEKIIAEIESGIKKAGSKNYEIIPDRTEALKKAIKMAGPNDVIVVPGMGHQKYRNVGGDKKIPWDEVKILENLLK